LPSERHFQRLSEVRRALASGRLHDACAHAARLEEEGDALAPRLRAMNLQLGATALQAAGEGRRSEEWARRGLRLAVLKAREPRLVPAFLNLLGEQALAAGRTKRARTCFRHAERGFTESGDAGGVAAARGNLALALIREGRVEEARAALFRAASGFDESGNAREAARTRLVLSDLLRDRGDLEGVRRVLDAARAALDAQGPGALQVEWWIRRGVLAEAEGRPAAAQAPYAAARRAADEAQLDAAHPVIDVREAERLLLAGRGREARLHALAALDRDRAAGALSRQATDRLILARCELLELRADLSEEWILGAESIYRDMGDPRGGVAVRFARALAALTDGEVSRARRIAAGALEDARGLRFDAAARAAQGLLAGVRLHLGELDGLDDELRDLGAEARARGEGTHAVQLETMSRTIEWARADAAPVDEIRASLLGLVDAGFDALAAETLVTALFLTRSTQGEARSAELADLELAPLAGASELRWVELRGIRDRLAGRAPTPSMAADSPLRARALAAERLAVGRIGPALSGDERVALPALIRMALERVDPGV
jgi:hypothetical protein